MKRKKKKGFTLLLAIEACLILSILSISIISLAFASYRTTIRNQRVEKLKKRAESCIQKEYSNLKQYVMENPDVMVNHMYDADLIKNEGGFNSADNNDDGITCHVDVIAPDDTVRAYPDAVTGRNVPFIEMTAKAQYYDGNDTSNTVGSAIKLDVVIDKDTVYNEYFQRIFNSSLTVAPSESSVIIGNPDSDFTLEGPKLTVSKNVLLQGNSINFLSNNLDINEGELRVKTPSYSAFSNNFINSLSDATTGEPINLVYDDASTKGVDPSRTGWIRKNLDYLPLLKIDQAGAQNWMASTIAVDPACVQIQGRLIKYKVYTSGAAADFYKIINGDAANPGIYNIITSQAGFDPRDYATYHKMIIIDGDLKIDNYSANQINYNNYIIYCTGTVTVDCEAEFYNSSIFANKIELHKNATIHGIGSRLGLAHVMYHDPNDNVDVTPIPFSSIDQDNLNAFMLRNLYGYGDYLNFRVLSWQES